MVVRFGLTTRSEIPMTDPHQVISIITTAIVNCGPDVGENNVEVEKAKYVAKCILTALSDAGLEIVPTAKKS
jgi:hypothetical protein